MLAFVLAVAGTALLPGYLIVRILRIRLPGPALLPVSAIVSMGSITAASAYLGLLGIPFDAYSYAAMLLLLVAAFIVLRPPPLKCDLRKLAAFAVPPAILFLVLISGFSGFITPPHGDDASNHCLMVKEIITEKATQFNPWYNTAFHSIAALAIEFSGFPLQEAPFYLIMFLAALLPLSIGFFTAGISKDERLGLAAGFTSILFFFFPYHPFMWGGWPTIAALALLPAACALFLRALKDGSTASGALSGIALTGLLYLHTQEMITAALFLLVLGTAALAGKKSARPGIRAASLAAAVFLLLSAPGLYGALTHPARAQDIPTETMGLAQAAATIALEVFNIGLNPRIALLAVAGIAVALKERRLMPMLLLQALFLALFYISQTTALLSGLVHAGSWSVPMRLEYIQIYFVSFFSALGLLLAIKLLKEKKRPILRSLAAAVLLFTALFAVSTLASYSGYLHSLLGGFTAVTEDDLQVMQWAQENLPKNATILLDYQENAGGSADAGAWFPALTDLRCIRYNVPGDANCPSCIGADYVFAGEKLITGRNRTFDASRLLADGTCTIAVRRGDSFLLKCPG